MTNVQDSGKRNRWSGKKAGWMTIALILTVGCVDPYTPNSIKVNYSYLVIDGLLDTGGDTSRFVLARTQPVSTDSNYITPEIANSVTIEEDGGQTYSLSSSGNGNYFLPPNLVDNTKTLRMHILSSDGREYVSEYVPSLTTPPIDNIAADTNLSVLNGVSGMDISVSTHDATNSVKYFLWRYDETWEYTSAFASSLIYDYDSIRDRTASESIYYCYSSSSSTNVLVSSTTDLSVDAISNFRLIHIAATSPKLAIKYSINVHQYGLTKEAYEFWVESQKNTENLGSIFGSLPVTVTGNFTCVTDPSIPVIGFFSASSVSAKRIFVTHEQLPPLTSMDPFYAGCQMFYVPLDQVINPTTLLYLNGVYKLTQLIGYNEGSPLCSDCRKHGGTTTVPSFWK